MRWWASLALVAGCQAALPPELQRPGASGAPDGASCKVSSPVCDPAMTDEAALALVERRCAGCHADGGAAARPFLEAGALVRERANVALRLAGCEMPPDATPLPAAERARLIGWGACAQVETAGLSGTRSPFDR